MREVLVCAASMKVIVGASGSAFDTVQHRFGIKSVSPVSRATGMCRLNGTSASGFLGKYRGTRVASNGRPVTPMLGA